MGSTLKNSLIILSITLAASLSANVYFFDLVVKWQEAWLAQTLATIEVESLFRTSDANTTYEGIVNLLDKAGDEYKVVTVTEVERGLLPNNPSAILVNDTKLLFSSGQYAGSTANVPKGIKHWGQGGLF